MREHFSVLEAVARQALEADGGIMEPIRPWTVLKQLAIKNILGMYLPILKAQAWVRTSTFIDTNESCGVNALEQTGHEIAGSALVAASMQAKFDRYVFIEADNEKCDALRARVKRFLPDGCFDVIEGTCDQPMPEVMGSLPRKDALFFAVVDPYTLSAVPWKSLEPLLASSRGDVLVNVQTTHFKRGPPSAAGSFMGTPYVHTLIEQNAPEREFLRLYQQQLEPHRPVQETIRIMSGETRYYYDLVYAAARTRGDNPWMRALAPIKSRVERLTGNGVINILQNKGILDSYGDPERSS